MEKSNLKNIVVLKNLPSNIVDEAIVILKPNKKIKKPETEEYVLKDAEMLISEYISEIERIENKTDSNTLFKKKYNRLKKYTIFSYLILIMSIIFNFI